MVLGFAKFQAIKNPSIGDAGVFGIRRLTMTYSHMGNATLPSALVCFTSEFGMGSGGSRPLWSSGKTVDHWGTRENGVRLISRLPVVGIAIVLGVI